MTGLEISILSIALAMDAMSVSVASALTTRNNYLLNALKVSFCFGFFQSLMPVLGYWIGDQSSEFIKSIGHWISFCLLVVIGCDMIVKAFKEEEINNKETLLALLVLAIATSLDAFAVGITFSLLDVNLILSVVIIGIITFGLCFIVSIIASKLAKNFQKQSQIIGGIILIVIAIKIIIEHNIL